MCNKHCLHSSLVHRNLNTVWEFGMATFNLALYPTEMSTRQHSLDLIVLSSVICAIHYREDYLQLSSSFWLDNIYRYFQPILILWGSNSLPFNWFRWCCQCCSQLITPFPKEKIFNTILRHLLPIKIIQRTEFSCIASKYQDKTACAGNTNGKYA